ncbi:methylenetetrahydrofolate reductase [Aminipila sp.]|uniref:methylenetetrahydrofolate reductase n=1 Tax=Aminipila sp. TaxID=2060095 RepID=UPI001D4AC5DD|nr:methylenetetrahydrofolate reductase [Aminipila sp.]MBE6033601.1 5,10-methylenetetrahydrofolate reductase [Clostridiales bacterium]
MKISQMLKERITYSFEVFPPKMEQSLEPLKETLDQLYKCTPDFISCTYGAGGTNKGRSTELCEIIEKSNHNVMTHFTCIGNTKKDVLNYMNEYISIGVENVLALRGDIPHGLDGTNGDFSNANQLIAFIRENFSNLCLAAACYPEKHMEASSIEEDINFLKLKQDCGAEFLMTQLCHDVEAYESFMDKIRNKQIVLPVVVGIMPVLSKDAIIRMTVSNGCSIPKELAEIIGKYGDEPEEFKKAGKEFTVKQISRYMDAGINGLHIYSLNKYRDIVDILHASGIHN